jgi:hypothetical protein
LISETNHSLISEIKNDTSSNQPSPKDSTFISNNNSSENNSSHLTIPKVIAVSSSAETLTGTFLNNCVISIK